MGAAGEDGPRYAIVVGRFYTELAERLVASATGVFEAHAGAGSVDVFDVPGLLDADGVGRPGHAGSGRAGVPR